MARVTVEDCVDKVESPYELVLVAKERTTQLNSGSPMLVEEDNDKKTIIALREIGDGKLSINDLEKNAITRLRKEPDEVEELEETEEEVNDDFEKLYKGQVSKSGRGVPGVVGRVSAKEVRQPRQRRAGRARVRGRQRVLRRHLRQRPDGGPGGAAAAGDDGDGGR